MIAGGVVDVVVGLVGVVCHIQDIVRVYHCIVVVLVKIGYIALVVGEVVGEVGVVALKRGDKVGLIVDVLGYVEVILVIVECGLVCIVVGV